MSQGYATNRTNIATGTINSATISVLPNLPQGSITVTAGTINTGTINSATINSGSIVQTAGTQSVGTVNTGTINTGTINSGTINAGTFSMTSGTLNVGTVMNNGGSVNTIGTFAEFSGSASSASGTIIGTMDISSYRFISIQLQNTFVGTAQFQQSNDGTTYFAQPMVNAANNANGLSATGMSAVGIFNGFVNAHYGRVIALSYTSGTIQAVADFFTVPSVLNTYGVTSSQSGAYNVTGTVAIGSIAVTAGTITAGTINAGTVQLNPKPTTNIIPYGTVSSGTIGTVIAAAGVGTAIYITSFSVDTDAGALGTPDLCLSYGTVTGGGSVVFRGGVTTPFGLSFPNPIGGGITNQPLTWLQLANSGTVAINVTYFVQ